MSAVSIIGVDLTKTAFQMHFFLAAAGKAARLRLATIRRTIFLQASELPPEWEQIGKRKYGSSAMINNGGLPGLMVIVAIVFGIFFLLKRDRQKGGGDFSVADRRSGNFEQRPNIARNDAGTIDSLVKQICVGTLEGKRKTLPVPLGYRDYPVGRILEAFAQNRHPDDIKQGQLTRDPTELKAAVERLQRVAQSLYPTPELTDYFSRIETLRGRVANPTNATLSHEEQIEVAAQDWDSKVPELQSRALQTFESLVRQNTENVRPYNFLCGVYALTDLRGKSDEIVRMRRRICELDPENSAAMEKFEDALFSHAKIKWDDNNKQESFGFYLEGLRSFAQRGGELNYAAPLNCRVAFRAARMFAKEALDEHEDASLGAELMDLCEEMGIDINHEVDVSDLRG